MTFELLNYESPIGAPQFKRPMTIEETRKDYYGAKATDYDLNRESCEKWNKENAAVHAALENKTGAVLDIPCGTGRFFQMYQDFGLDFIGLDVSEEMMCQARIKAPQNTIEFGDIMEIPFGDKEVDHSLCIRLLEKMTEDEMVAAIKSLARVTKKTIICSLITGPKQVRRNRSWVHREEAFVSAVESGGFKVTRAYQIRKNEMFVWHCESC